MYGAILGDMIGAPYEFDRGNNTKDFEMFNDRVCFTDDSVMTIAVADALMRILDDAEDDDVKTAVIQSMQKWGKKYPRAGYGQRFFFWLGKKNPQPYGSWGNGSAMRVSPVGWAANSLDEAIAMSDAVTRVTHNHPEGMAGAAVTAACVYMARTGASMKEMREYVTKTYSDLSFTLDSIREKYEFDVSCRGSVPQSLEAFFESTSFEDAIRNAISIGGDSDTIGAITGSIAGAYYGVPNDIRNKALSYLDDFQRETISEFEALWPEKRG